MGVVWVCKKTMLSTCRDKISRTSNVHDDDGNNLFVLGRALFSAFRVLPVNWSSSRLPQTLPASVFYLPVQD